VAIHSWAEVTHLVSPLASAHGYQVPFISWNGRIVTGRGKLAASVKYRRR
jgi:hypothetical protein